MNVTKTYDELTFADDFMFCQIMVDNPELCRKVIELILQQPIKRVVVSKQHEKKYRNDRRGIRLDVYADDTAGSIYDIEMQTSASTPIPMRSRYYQSMIDTGYLHSGKSHDIVIDEHLRNFLDYVASGEAKDDLTREIDENIATAKDNEEWREEYMSFDIILKENMDIARAEGKAVGLVEGKAIGLIEGKAIGLVEGKSIGKTIGEAFGIIMSERRHNSTDEETLHILMTELNVDLKKAMELIADYDNLEK